MDSETKKQFIINNLKQLKNKKTNLSGGSKYEVSNDLISKKGIQTHITSPGDLLVNLGKEINFENKTKEQAKDIIKNIMTQNSNKPIKCEWMKDLNKNKSVVGDPAWGPALSTDKITCDRRQNWYQKCRFNDEKKKCISDNENNDEELKQLELDNKSLQDNYEKLEGSYQDLQMNQQKI